MALTTIPPGFRFRPRTGQRSPAEQQGFYGLYRPSNKIFQYYGNLLIYREKYSKSSGIVDRHLLRQKCLHLRAARRARRAGESGAFDAGNSRTEAQSVALTPPFG